jgi:hypothetical protein
MVWDRNTPRNVSGPFRERKEWVGFIQKRKNRTGSDLSWKSGPKGLTFSSKRNAYMRQVCRQPF